MKDTAAFLLDSASSGTYAAPATASVLAREAAARGLAWFDLDLSGVANKTGFLARCAAGFGLPATFGRNWDALADCIEDLSWRKARGYVVHCHDGGEFARRAPRDAATAREILAGAAHYWRSKHVPFVVLLDASISGSDVPRPLPWP